MADIRPVFLAANRMLDTVQACHKSVVGRGLPAAVGEIA
jgi:hypothetical protein